MLVPASGERQDGPAVFAARAIAQSAFGQQAVAFSDLELLSDQERQAKEALARAQALEARAAQVLTDSEEIAAAKLASAVEQVEAILSQAAEGAVAIGQQAQEEGAREGWEVGYQEGLTAARAEAEAIRAEAIARRDALLEKSQQEVLDLALVIAKQVVRAELTLLPEAILPMVEGALARMKGDENPTVRVGPLALVAVQEAYGRLLQALPGARAIELVADASLQEGDFLVQGDIGMVDGRVESQVASVETALREELE